MNHIKHKIARWLFADEVEKISLEREAFKIVSKSIKNKEEEYYKWMKSRTVTDMCRERLAGFDFKENEKDLIASIPKERRMEYLEEAVTMKEGDVLPFIIDYMIRKQVEAYTNEAETIETINFGRATLNGIALVEEGIDSLVTEYENRTKEKEDFDEHSAV